MLFYAKRCYLIFTVTFVEIAWNVIFGAIRSSQKEAVRIQIYGNWFGRFVDRFDPNALHGEQNCSSESSLFYSRFNLWGAVELIKFLIIHCAYVFLANNGLLWIKYGIWIQHIHTCLLIYKICACIYMNADCPWTWAIFWAHGRTWTPAIVSAIKENCKQLNRRIHFFFLNWLIRITK